MSKKHPFEFVDLKVGENPVEIDVELVDLIKDLNYIGWRTNQSCQNNIKGRVWLCFDTSYHAENFLSLIVLEGTKKLSGCVKAATTQKYDESKNIWEYKDRWWVDSHTRSTEWPRTGISIEISVRFPRKHLSEVISIVSKAKKDHN